MKYRRFGRLNWEASVLGFGAMRLPILGGDYSKIDDSKALKMLSFAFDNRVNYVDSGYTYHEGKSEPFLGKALRNRYRDKVKVATKMPCWLVHSREDMDKYLNEQLDRLRIDCLDFYLFHGLTGERWCKLSELNALDWAERKMDEGKITHLGFSFHDTYATFKHIIDSYDNWTMCQILYNYVDSAHEAGTKGLRYAASKNLAVVVMEPIAGGRLAMPTKDEIQAIWDKADDKRSPAAWALLWVWNQPEVTLALSGMSTIEQVKENVKTADIAKPGILSKRDLALYKRVVDEYKRLGYVNCSGCRYCQPCPNGVDIPTIISLYNEYYAKDRDKSVRARYKKQVPKKSRAKLCTRCGKCEELCPQQLPIRRIISTAAFTFQD
jgi:predicted aldo/keto reductase-like oxidoreductase